MAKQLRERQSVEIEKTLSYVMGVPRNKEDILDIATLVERLKETSLFAYRGLDICEEGDPIISLNYEGTDYLVQLILEDVEVPELFRINHRFSQEDYEILTQSEIGITTAMKFSEDVMESYLVQLKVIYTLMPDLIGLIDYSAERIYSGVWATLAAQSKVPPSPNYLYSIQAVSNEEADCVWMHTHGLNRCGRIELELLDMDKENYQDYSALVQGFADRLLSKPVEEIAREGEAQFIAYTHNRESIVATWIPWESAVGYYDEEMLGGAKSHEEHGWPSGVIYLYLNEEDYQNGKLVAPNALGDQLHDNIVVFFSDKETERMRALAQERFEYFRKYALNKDYHSIVKFGLSVDKEYEENSCDGREHIWFEILEINGNKMKAKLTQEPYMIKNLKVHDILELDVEQMTDWLIYTPEFSVNPDEIYLLEG